MGLEGTFPASDPLGFTSQDETSAHEHSHKHTHAANAPKTASHPTEVVLESGEGFILDHGAVAIAAITSCTNTSNPSVMLAAGAAGPQREQEGSEVEAVGQDHPRARVEGRHGLLREVRAHRIPRGPRLLHGRLRLHDLIGNSGPLIDEISAAVNQNDLAVTAVLSGNRNFEGRINPDVKMNYLASPPLVIAYALAGSMNFDFEKDALGQDSDGNDVFLADIWPDAAEVQATIDSSIDTGDVHHEYARRVRRRRPLALPSDADRSHVRVGREVDLRAQTPVFRRNDHRDAPVASITGARVLAKLGDSVTTDHISPAGSIKADSPAGHYLTPTASTARTTTPTGRAAATTRS